MNKKYMIFSVISSVGLFTSHSLMADAFIESEPRGVIAYAPNFNSYNDSQGYFNGCNDSQNYLDCCNDLIFGIEALYWTPCQQGIPFAVRTEFRQPEPPPIPTRALLTSTVSDVKNLKFDWNAGFRLAVGKSFGCDNINAYLEWTHYQTDARGHVNNESHPSCCETDTYLIPTIGLAIVYGPESVQSVQGSNGTIVDPTEIHAKWKVHLDLLDFLFSKTIDLRESVKFTPFIGARGGWINQSFHLNAKGSPIVSTFSSEGVATISQNFEHNNVVERSHFRGGGIKAGFTANWDVGCDFSLYGTLSGSLLYGTYENKSHQAFNKYYLTIEGGSVVADNFPYNTLLESDHCGALATADYAIGLEWSRGFCEDSKSLAFRLGWEQHMFFDQSRFESPGDEALAISEYRAGDGAFSIQNNPQKFHDNLSIQGIVFSARFNY